MGICSSTDKEPKNDSSNPSTNLLSEILERKSEKLSHYGVPTSTEAFKAISMNNFEIIKLLGQGSTGKIYLVSKKMSNPKSYFAIKVIDKQLASSQNLQSYLQNERVILQYNSCPFLAKLSFSFQSAEKLFLGIEYLAGGDLFFHLSRGVFFTESAIRVYVAELVLALEYLHGNQVVYRDLKPENILFGKDGHVKLVDFGLSKYILKNQTPVCFTNCGSPEYVAPEVIRNEAYDEKVDWWSLVIGRKNLNSGGHFV